MRPRVALFDDTLGDHLELFILALPSHWMYAVVSNNRCIANAPAQQTILPKSRSQSCQCAVGACIRDTIVAWLPDRALVIAVLQQPSLRCIAECADVIFATGEVARWCYQRNIPVHHALSVEQLYQLFTRALQRHALTTRHQAQIYRKHLLEIE